MTHAFVFHRLELVAAAASGAGSLPLIPKAGSCTSGPGSPVPILLVHGTADTRMPCGGGCVANLSGACNRGRVILAEATRDRWLQINGLVGSRPALTVLERDPGDGGSANQFDHAGTFPMQWWRLDGAGHTVPSRTALVETNRMTGTQNRDVEFAEIVWSFYAARLRDGTELVRPRFARFVDARSSVAPPWSPRAADRRRQRRSGATAPRRPAVRSFVSNLRPGTASRPESLASNPRVSRFSR